MAKRFTDTEKWDRPWFRALSNQYKLLWCFILDKCDIAGIWYVDLEMASFQIGARFDRQKCEETFKKQIEISVDRWLLKDFVLFQYGSLEASNKIYRNVSSKILAFQEVASIPHTSPIHGSMVMDMDKDGSIKKEDISADKESDIGIKGPTAEDLVKLWNKEAHPNLPRVQILTEVRKRHALARLEANPGQEFWANVIAKVNLSPLLRGESGGWKASFDWILNPSNLIKIVEGNYDANKHR